MRIGDKFYIGVYWIVVFSPIQVITIITYLVSRFTGSDMAGDIAFVCNRVYVTLTLIFMSRDLYRMLRDEHKKNKEQSNPLHDEKR